MKLEFVSLVYLLITSDCALLTADCALLTTDCARLTGQLRPPYPQTAPSLPQTVPSLPQAAPSLPQTAPSLPQTVPALLANCALLTSNCAFLLLWFPSPLLAVSNGKSITQRLSLFVGHAPGVGYPSLCLIPDKLLRPCRVSSSYQVDSCRRDYLHYEQSYKIRLNLDFYTLQLYIQWYFTKVQLGRTNSEI